MDTAELQKIAEHSRSMREIGIGLVIASVILAFFLFIPLTYNKTSPSVVLVATSTVPNAFVPISLEADAAIVYDLATGETIYGKNIDAQLPLASLTKLLTVYAALAELPPNTPVTISRDASQLETPRAFREGQTFSLSDLARLTLTASLNDGAAAIAEATAARGNRSQSETLALAAAALGLSQTYAVNGNGLDVNTALSGGYGSAQDLARLSGALVDLVPEIAAATTLKSAYAVSMGGTAYNVKNTDPIVDEIPHLLLSKTGYTDLAGGNLALVFDVGIQHPIAIVILGSGAKSRFTDGSALVAATLAHFADIATL